MDLQERKSRKCFKKTDEKLNPLHKTKNKTKNRCRTLFFKALTEQKKYGKDNADDAGMIAINALSKPYDGRSYSVRDLSQTNPLYTGEVDNKNIWQNITYVCQYYNEQTQKLGSEISMTTTPSDSGLSRFTLTSTQYSNDEQYKESYYGHRAYGWCEISRVPAVVNLTKVEWGNLKDDGSWEVVDDAKQDAGNRIKVEFNIRSQVGTALTLSLIHISEPTRRS